ncbi:hypothetical protein Ancab_007514 [Ancistrocladus abbreviatus]
MAVERPLIFINVADRDRNSAVQSPYEERPMVDIESAIEDNPRQSSLLAAHLRSLNFKGRLFLPFSTNLARCCCRGALLTLSPQSSSLSNCPLAFLCADVCLKTNHLCLCAC